VRAALLRVWREQRQGLVAGVVRAAERCSDGGRAERLPQPRLPLA